MNAAEPTVAFINSARTHTDSTTRRCPRNRQPLPCSIEPEKFRRINIDHAIIEKKKKKCITDVKNFSLAVKIVSTIDDKQLYDMPWSPTSSTSSELYLTREISSYQYRSLDHRKKKMLSKMFKIFILVIKIV